jgi:hypothetical protein
MVAYILIILLAEGCGYAMIDYAIFFRSPEETIWLWQNEAFTDWVIYEFEQPKMELSVAASWPEEKESVNERLLTVTALIFLKDSNTDFKVYPDRVDILIGKTQLELIDSGDFYKKLNPNHQYYVYKSFNYPPPSNEGIQIAAEEDLNLVIVMDDMIEYKGESLPIDTIRGSTQPPPEGARIKAHLVH